MNTQEERDLTRSLQNQADQFHGAGVTFDGVTSRSRSITRRRRMVAGAGVLAAAAIIVPAATFFGGQTPANTEIPPATQVPSKDPSPIEPTDPTDAADAEVSHAFTSDVAQGAAPQIAYIEGRTLHRPDGSTVQLLKGDYIDLATQGDVSFAVRSGGETNDLYIFDEVGNAAEPFVGVDSVVAAADGSVVAWIDGSGEVWTYGESGRFSLGQVEPGSYAVAVVGTGPCDGSQEGSACGVYYNQPGEAGPMNISDAGPVSIDASLIKLADVTEMGMVAGQTSYTDDSSCHVVLDENRERVFKTCDRVPFQFSPSAAYLTANPTSYLDGFGSSGLNILDLEGNDVAWWTNEDEPQSKKDIVYSHVWEDDEHVLVISSGPSGWHVLRVGVDGSIEKALGPSTGGDQFSPSTYVLDGH